jgi:hypothetical protein
MTPGLGETMGYRRTAHVAWRRVGGQTIVINLRTSTVLGLNEAGGAAWEALGGAPRPALLPADQTADEFFNQLEADGVVETVEGRESLPFACASPPAVEWRDSLQVFAAGCPPHPGIEICDAQPGS